MRDVKARSSAGSTPKPTQTPAEARHDGERSGRQVSEAR